MSGRGGIRGGPRGEADALVADQRVSDPAPGLGELGIVTGGEVSISLLVSLGITTLVVLGLR